MAPTATPTHRYKVLVRRTVKATQEYEIVSFRPLTEVEVQLVATMAQNYRTEHNIGAQRLAIGQLEDHGDDRAPQMISMEPL